MKTLRKGDRGEDVKTLQTALNANGYDCGKVDGIFGTKTQKAVKAYQKAHALTVDGIVGRQTWNSLGYTDPDIPTDVTQPPNFKQYDSRWGSKMYSSHGDKKQTMKSSGCGPTSMADIVAAWWDKDATPWTLAEYSLKWGTRTYDSGTSGTFFKKCAEYYKASKYQTTSSVDAAIECLKKGGLVIVCFGKSKWTQGGHYCCLWKWDGNKFHVNDPASSASNRATGSYNEVKAARKSFYLFYK